MGGIIPSTTDAPGYREPTGAEADSAIETARGEWERMARIELDAGREIPVRELPRDIAPEAFRTSAEATSELMRRASRRSYTVGIDLRALELRRRIREAAEAAAIPMLGGAVSALAAREAAAMVAAAHVPEEEPAPAPAPKSKRKRASEKRIPDHG